MRLFVAIPVPENIRAPLLSISSGIRGARWVRPEGMHITLFFAGEVDRAQANDLDAELESVHMLPFDANGLAPSKTNRSVRSMSGTGTEAPEP